MNKVFKVLSSSKFAFALVLQDFHEALCSQLLQRYETVELYHLLYCYNTWKQKSHSRIRYNVIKQIM